MWFRLNFKLPSIEVLILPVGCVCMISQTLGHSNHLDAAVFCRVQVVLDKPFYEKGKCLFVAAKVCH